MSLLASMASLTLGWIILGSVGGGGMLRGAPQSRAWYEATATSYGAGS